MTTWYAQTGNCAWTSVAWNDQPDGSGNSGTPTGGDTADLNGNDGIVLDVDPGNIAVQGATLRVGSLTIYSNISLGCVLQVIEANTLQISGAWQISGRLEVLSQATLYSNGVLNVLAGGSLATAADGLFRNNGTITVETGGTVENCSLENSNEINVAAGAAWSSPNQMSQLTGGHFHLDPASNVSFFGVPVRPVPAAQNVRFGTAVLDSTGTCRVPSPDDVQQGVAVDATTGNFAVPLPTDVRSGLQYGAHGTEFTGTLATLSPDSFADAVLSRSVAHVEASADVNSLCYVVLAMLRSNTTAHPGKLTVFRTDGQTEFAQRSIASAANADPIVGIA